jgi:hypothetical protein
MTDALDVGNRNIFPYEIFETRELTVTLMQKFTETSKCVCAGVLEDIYTRNVDSSLAENEDVMKVPLIQDWF